MAFYFRVSGKTTSTISESSQAGGPSKLSPKDIRLRTKPNAKSTVEVMLDQEQQDIISTSLHNAGLVEDSSGHIGHKMSKHKTYVRGAEAFLKQMKTDGTVDANGKSHLADMTQAQKEELVTLRLNGRSRPHERDNARYAIISYADRNGYKRGKHFKDSLLNPCHFWVDGKSVETSPFKLLGKTSDPTKRDNKGNLILDRKKFTPENLEKVRVSNVLEGKLRSAGQKHPTLANLDPLLSPDDVTNLNKQDALFSKDGGIAPIRTLLHVSARDKDWDGVSGSESRQKIREVMLLATAKEATAAEAESRDLSPEKLKAIKMELLTAGQRGPKKLAKRYNEEMANLALQPGTPDAPGLSEIGRTSADAETYRADFQASVKKWSEDNGHRFIAVPKLQELSRMAAAPILNKRKLDAHKAALENGQDPLLQDKDSKFKKDYLERMKNEVIKEGDKNGRILNDEQFNKLVWRTYNHVLYNN